MANEESTTIYKRVRALGDSETMEEDGKIRLLASTADAVDWGGWREVLKHEAGSIDMGAARSLLINHNPNLLAGGISGMTIDGNELSSNAEIDEDVRMPSGMSVRKAVKKRYLGGVSVGYTYEMKDTQYDEETRTLTVNKWRLLEISLTPIPADARAQVRSLPSFPVPSITAAPAAERAIMPEPIKPQENPVVPSVDEAARAREMADLRTQLDASKREAKLRALASEHGVDVVGVDFASFKDEAAGITELLKRKAKVEATSAPQHAVTQIRVDAMDKARDAAVAAMALNAGFRDEDALANNPMAGRSMRNIIKQFATMCGERTNDWDEKDIARYATGHPELIKGRSAANVTSSMFPNFVFLNAVTKIAALGAERSSSLNSYGRITSKNTAPDFRTFYIGALGVGNLTETAEDVAFPELTKTEGVYNSTVKMWGGTVSLTYQALVNDDMGQFNRVLANAGALRDKTVDRRTFQKLLMGTSTSTGTSTWTNNTTSGGSLVYTTADLAVAARGKLGLVRAALGNKVGMDGNPLGTRARFLLVPVTREVEAQGIVGPISPGQIGQDTGQSISKMEVISSEWLEASALTGNSTTSYYLLGDPNEVTGLVLTGVQGHEGITVEPYDAGAVAAVKFKLWTPFEVDLVNMTNTAGTVIIPAAQQGTT